MVNEFLITKERVILQDLSITLYFVFCNTKAHSREKHLAQITDLLVGTWCSMLWKNSVEHVIVSDLFHCGWPSQILLFFFLHYEAKIIVFVLKIKKESKWLHGFQTFISLTFLSLFIYHFMLEKKIKEAMWIWL